MSRARLERRLRDELRAARPPAAAEAERRAWQVVRAAHASRLPVQRRRRGARFAVAAAAAAVVAAVALTPAGAKVEDWIGDVVSPAPDATRSTLSSLPAEGRLLVVADGGPWIVQDDGARRQLGGYDDATWSPGGLFVAAARGRELVALEPDGAERWTRPAPGRVTTPRWSPDGYRIAYRSGARLYVAYGDNQRTWLLARHTRPAPPAWRPLAAPAEQVLAFAAGKRVHVVEVDTGRVLGRTPPGPPPTEIWWGDEGRRLVTVTSGSVRIHDPRGRLLRVVELPRGLRAAGSAMAPAGSRLAIIARPARGRSSELLLLRPDRPARPRPVFSWPTTFDGIAWSMDGKVLLVGLPLVDQWLFLHPRRSVQLEAVKDVRDRFGGGREPRTGAFPRPAGWCWTERVNRTPSGQPPCSVGSASSAR